MNHVCCLLTLSWLACCLGAYGQDITFDQPHPITYPELANPSVPLVLENSNRDYFIKHVYNQHASYGGLLSKKWLTIGPELLSFYEETTLLHLAGQKRSAFIGTDTTSQISYYTNSKARDGRFAGLFATKPHQRRIKKLALPGFDARDIHSFYMNATRDILIFSMQRKRGAGREDLYVSLLKDGGWTAPISLGPSVNTEGAEISPFLSSDTKKLFFSSDGHGGYGQGDLFMAERLYDSWQVWGQPTNLGKEINSSGYEAYLGIMEDSVAYFFSETDGQGKLWTAHVTAPSQRNSLRKAANTRSYLSQEEAQAWLGTSIDTTLSFVPGDVALTRNSQESLWFVANRMISNPEIHINISFFSYATDDRAKAKSIIVRNYLTLLGLNEKRVAIQLLDPKEPVSPVEATFNFFRLKQ